MQFIRKTNEEFIQELKDKNIIYTPLEEYKGSSTKIKWYCPKCKNTFYASPNNILKGRGCSYCRKGAKAILVGFNDMWTTNPKLASMLLNPDDGYNYTQNSHKYTDWVCPTCHSIIHNKRISYVNEHGVSCPNCSDGASYPEKFVFNMLKQLRVDFVYDQTREWSKARRYDFYIEDLSLIIECHGSQHYIDGFVSVGGKSAKEQREIDVYKKSLALENNIKTYIELDCKISKFEYIKNSIMDSALSKIFDLSNIDWDECDEYSIDSSRIIEVCKLWNEIKDTKRISTKLRISRAATIDYLKKGSTLGLCDYNAKDNMRKSKSKSVICIETNKIYEKISNTIQDGFNPRCVSNCCRGIQDNHKGCHFKYYDKEVS